MATLYVAAPPEAARDLATALVEERYAAAVNRVSCRSTYRWDGELTEEAEELLFVKTTRERGEDAVAFIEERHPYDVPCIEGFDEDAAHGAFAQWVAEGVEE